MLNISRHAGLFIYCSQKLTILQFDDTQANSHFDHFTYKLLMTRVNYFQQADDYIYLFQVILLATMSWEILTYFSYNAFFFTKQCTCIHTITRFVYIHAARFKSTNSIRHYLSKHVREVLEVKRNRGFTHGSSELVACLFFSISLFYEFSFFNLVYSPRLADPLCRVKASQFT